MVTCSYFRAAIIKHASIGMDTHELNHILEPQVIASAVAGMQATHDESHVYCPFETQQLTALSSFHCCHLRSSTYLCVQGPMSDFAMSHELSVELFAYSSTLNTWMRPG